MHTIIIWRQDISRMYSTAFAEIDIHGSKNKLGIRFTQTTSYVCYLREPTKFIFGIAFLNSLQCLSESQSSRPWIRASISVDKFIGCAPHCD